MIIIIKLDLRSKLSHIIDKIILDNEPEASYKDLVLNKRIDYLEMF
jgi:hypothetical protein